MSTAIHEKEKKEEGPDRREGGETISISAKGSG